MSIQAIPRSNLNQPTYTTYTGKAEQKALMKRICDEAFGLSTQSTVPVTQQIPPIAATQDSSKVNGGINLIV